MTGGAALPVPAYGKGSLADLLPAVLAGLGVPGSPAALEVPVGRQVCVLLVDGLGWNALRAEPATAPFLTSLLSAPGSRSLTSVFPSTTPIALTSLGTGLPPGVHGITGLVLRLESGQLVNMLARPAETDLRALQPIPTAFERAVAAGVAVCRVGPRVFDGNGLTDAGLRGGVYLGAESMGERIAAAASGVRAAATSLTYVYLGDLDGTGHRQGCHGEAWRQELAHVDRVAEQLAAALPAGSTLLVTSDHGMVDVPVASRYDLAQRPDLARGVEVLAGDPRGGNVHVHPGAAADVLAAWQAVLGEDFWVLSREEAVESGLFGPVVTDAVRPRIGDVVVASRGPATVLDSRVVPPAVLALAAGHGSLTPDELLVPLLVHHPG